MLYPFIFLNSETHAAYLSLLDLTTVIILKVPVSIAARSKASTVFGRSKIRIADSNPARGMDVCLCFSELCCPV
jgi:hypothetical protein